MDNREILVSLISDQTLPNVQLIKELRSVTDYLFVTTDSMEKKKVSNWIETVCKIDSKRKILVNQFSFEDINAKLSLIDFNIFKTIHVNLTGGTKLMTIAVNDFFRKICNQEVIFYYVTGKDNKYISYNSPDSHSETVFENEISLSDYLKSYGFKYTEGKSSRYSLDVASRICKLYCNSEKLTEYSDVIKFINKQRNLRKDICSDDYEKVRKFIEEIEFPLNNKDRIDKNEIMYLSGEWFEEYIGLSIKEELKLKDNDIFIGSKITKEIGDFYREVNDIGSLIGEKYKENINSPENEIDVMFTYNGMFYSIECKSSIISSKVVKNKKGEVIEKNYNILGETIYKVDSIKGRFGLYPKASIITLSNFKEYIDVETDKSAKNNNIKDMKALINRANISNIKLVDRNMILNSESISSLII